MSRFMLRVVPRHAQKESWRTCARSVASVSPLEYERWPAPDVRQTVDAIRKHYLVPRQSGRKKNHTKKDPGVSVSEAIRILFDRIKKGSAEKADAEIALEAWCILEGENANGVRGALMLKKTMQRDTTVLAFAPPALWEQAKAAGAAFVGSGELVQDIVDDKIKFDRCVATIDQMPLLTKLARILGPKGLMPNTKTGTLTNDIEGAIRAALLCSPFKIDRETAVLRLAIARASFSEAEVRANLKIILEYLQSQNKSTAAGQFAESIVLRLDDLAVTLARHEYGQTKGPKFMLALEKLRAQVASRADAAARKN